MSPRFINPDTIKKYPNFTTAYELYKKYLQGNASNAFSDDKVVAKKSSKTNNNDAVSCDSLTQCSEPRSHII
jgi:hypothetical protein